MSTTADAASQIRPPQHLRERVRGSEEGERKIVTVLFADIASSTALIDDRDAEDALRILKPTVDAMNDIVHHYEGICREQGDGIMATFGAPIAVEDHAVRACYAALNECYRLGMLFYDRGNNKCWIEDFCRRLSVATSKIAPR